MGGAASAIARAREDFAKGEYRWVAEVMNRIVFADPTNTEARELCAAAYDQLGYLAEASTWRNAYLFGAHELRKGPAEIRRMAVSPDMASALSVPMFFDSLAGYALSRIEFRGRNVIFALLMAVMSVPASIGFAQPL